MSIVYISYMSCHAARPSHNVAHNNCDAAAEALSTLDAAAVSSAKNLIPTVSSAV